MMSILQGGTSDNSKLACGGGRGGFGRRAIEEGEGRRAAAEVVVR